MLVRAVIFAFAFLFSTHAMESVWGWLLKGRVCNCTDDFGPSYIIPGGWVHGEVKLVDQIVPGPTEPDTIKRGWSVGGLWIIWTAMFGFTILISVKSASALAPD